MRVGNDQDPFRYSNTIRSYLTNGQLQERTKQKLLSVLIVVSLVLIFSHFRQSSSLSGLAQPCPGHSAFSMRR